MYGKWGVVPFIQNFFLSSSTSRRHTQLWNLTVPSSWITNLGALPDSSSSLIRSSRGCVAYVAQISSIRFGWISMAHSIGLAFGVTTLIFLFPTLHTTHWAMPLSSLVLGTIDVPRHQPPHLPFLGGSGGLYHNLVGIPTTLPALNWDLFVRRGTWNCGRPWRSHNVLCMGSVSKPLAQILLLLTLDHASGNFAHEAFMVGRHKLSPDYLASTHNLAHTLMHHYIPQSVHRSWVMQIPVQWSTSS